jgi:hypothetical protein
LLEDGGVVDGPVRALAGLWTVVGSTATVVVSVEFHAGGETGDGVAGGVLDGKLCGADGVQVPVASSPGAGVLATIWGVGAAGGLHGDGEIVTVDQAHVIVIDPTPTVEGNLSKGHWRSSTVTAALDPVTTVTSFAMSVAITVGTGPETSSPLEGNVDVATVVGVELESSVGGQLLVGVVEETDPDGEWTVVIDFDLMTIGNSQEGQDSYELEHFGEL